jgi:phosphomannomutase
LSSEPIISVSGLRGIVGDTLTPAVAERFASAFAELLPAAPVVITRDGRANGAELVPAVAAGLSQQGGRKVIDAGIAATPTTGVLVRHLNCAGGVQISASHNPAEWNGMKLFSAEGRVVPGEFGARVLARYRGLGAGDWGPDEPTPASSVESLGDTVSAHLKLIEATVDVARICNAGFRVLLDANHGAGSVLGVPLLKRMGCRMKVLGEKPDGRFAHTPEPTAENLASVCQQVTRAGAAIGFCQDPDADRLAIVDENGRYVGEEYTLAICIDHVLRHAPGPVVTNCSTSRMTEDLARKYGVPFFRSAVGEANVVDEMLARGAVIGGEGNGGVIDPRVVLVRDSFVGMALVLAAMTERELPVSALADELPRYAIHKTTIELPADKVPAALDTLEQYFNDATPDRLDGLRLDWPGAGRPVSARPASASRRDAATGGRWLLVRASNTEPLVRLVSEASTITAARRLCDEAANVIRQLK